MKRSQLNHLSKKMSRATRKTRAEIKKKNPEAPEDILSLADLLDDSKDVALFAKSEGGKVLARRLIQVISSNANSIMSGYQTLSHAELVARCADFTANVNLYRAIVGAEKNVEDLELIMKDTLEQS